MTQTLNLDLHRIVRLIPGYDPFATAPPGAWFDDEAALDAIAFFPERLRHVEGALAGEPFILEPWQQAIVGNLFGWKRKDKHGREVRRYRECLLYVPRKNGKPLAVRTPIPTPGGWKAMGDLVAGDYVFDENGLPCEVLEAMPVMFGKRCYRLGFSDGTSIVADAEHLWVTERRRTGRKAGGVGPGVRLPTKQIVTTEEIARTLYVDSPSARKVGEKNHRITVADALQCEPASLPIHPYTLGVWLGDGDSDAARITVSMDDTELLGHLSDCGCKHGVPKLKQGTNTARVCIGSYCTATELRKASSQKPCLNKTLRRLGLLGNKHIPAVYLRASVSQREALLQGLMDTDGYAARGGQCEFTTTLPKLRDGVLELIRSLGIKTKISTGRATVNGKDCGDKYRIQFYVPVGISPFRLSRKASRVRPVANGRSRTRQIVSVDPVPSEAVRCIRVNSPSNLFLAGPGMVPTHNSPLAAGIALYVLFCDPEKGQQNYLVASTKEQAGLVLFRHCRGMIENNDALSGSCKVFGGSAPAGQSQSIVRASRNSFLKIIAADTTVGKHGKNPNLVIADELHEFPDRDIIDTFHTAMVSENKPQPLMLYTTTSDYARESICNEIHDYACKVRDGIIDQSAFLPVVYEAAATDDWTSPIVWAASNPNLGVSVSEEALAAECKVAKEIPSKENEFKRLHLNIKTEQDCRWLPMDRYDAADGELDPAAFEGKSCYCGLDLSTTTDLSAFAMVFPRDKSGYDVLMRFWVPDSNARQREKRDRVPYQQWIKEGWITATPGDTINYDVIRKDINDLRDRYDIREIAADRWNATQIIQQLTDDGFTIAPFGQGYKDMSPAAKEVERAIVAGELSCGKNPVERWMASHVAIEMDPAGNIKPSKAKSTERIDGIVALAMGVARAQINVANTSAYADHGLYYADDICGEADDYQEGDTRGSDYQQEPEGVLAEGEYV